MALHVSIPILSERDIVIARQKIGELAAYLGFMRSESVLIATIVSELARNIILYADQGEITISSVEEKKRKGIEIIASDTGPGIPDLDKALQEGHSTSGSLGMGLPGVKGLMDEFQIISDAGRGTMVKVRKWTQ